MINITNPDKIHLLSQGSYGCIYKPGLNCNGKIDKLNFVRKIVKDDTIFKNEKFIGGFIKKIKNYNFYFAPVISSCPISISTINNNEMKNCDIINNKTDLYVSNKIKFVGDKTIEEYFIYIFKYSPNIFFKMFFFSFLHLLDAIILLFKNKIIHYDLKENNILFDETNNKPIIIDFGLSFVYTDLTPSNALHFFYVYQDYPAWCFDINCINYILHIVGLDNINSNISTAHINTICNNFIDNNNMLKTLFETNEIESFRKNLFSFLNNFNGKPWIELYNELLKFNNSWDAYSVTVTFLLILKNLQLFHFPVFSKTIELLKLNILSLPPSRFTADILQNMLISLSNNNISKDIIYNQKLLLTNSNNNNFIDFQKQNSATSKQNMITNEKLIYGK